MPIHTAVPIQVFDQETFHQIDRKVTGLAFDIHNEFGRYLDEGLYQSELARRCVAVGLEIKSEFQMTVSLDDFRKDYFADLLVNHGVIIEIKAVEALSPAHRGQALNYLFLCGLHHGTLLNFRTERVQHEFVSSRLTPTDRRRFEVDINQWNPLTSESVRLHELMMRFLDNWGAYLDPLLYRDALTHFFGGNERVLRKVPVQSAGATIGTQEVHMLNDDIAFAVTASTHRPEAVFEHQKRFLEHTKLRAIQWVNLNHSHIELRTIERS